MASGRRAFGQAEDAERVVAHGLRAERHGVDLVDGALGVDDGPIGAEQYFVLAVGVERVDE